MLFNSYEYGFFFLVVLAVYHLVLRGRSLQNLALLAASYWFYAAWDWRFLSLIWISTAVDYVVGRRLGSLGSDGPVARRRAWLSMSLLTNLGLLGLFKYYGFFVDTAIGALDSLGLDISTSTLGIVLPVGISFYTFQTLSYTIDIWRGRLEPTRNLIDFALFVAFFPQLVAGPIERARRLLPQIQEDRSISGNDVAAGLYLILVGLVRKVVIADTAGLIADEYFVDPSGFGSVELLAGVLLYSLQIYGDFAGYSDIARGSARLLGFDLMRNFRHPYFSRSVSEFWQRWHISLSTWLRDYLYIPLGGNRRGRRRTYVNLMATMLLGGLWHGASWNFVLWGALHGVYLAGHRFLTARRERAGREQLSLGMGMTITFPLVALTWLTFRLTDVGAILEYIGGLFELSGGDVDALFPVVVLWLLVLLIDLPQHRTGNELATIERAPVVKGALAGTAIVLVILSGGGLEAPFIYFQF